MHVKKTIDFVADCFIVFFFKTGDSLKMAQGQKFSTYERDLDSTDTLHCAALTKGAWWA